MGTRQPQRLPSAAASRGQFRMLRFLVALLASTCIIAGCSVLGSNGPAPPTPTPAETPVPSAGSGLPAELEESVALLRPSGDPDEILGSAAVMSSEGLLLTSASVVSSDMEAVLPDGQVLRPILVTVQPDVNLALLKVPAERLVPVRFSTERLTEGMEVFATGYDGAPGSIGRMSGSVVGTVEDEDVLGFRVRGPQLVDTDINLVTGFRGGVLSDDDGAFVGVLVSGEDAEGNTIVRAVSNWTVLGWMEARENHLEELSERAEGWDELGLPGGWGIRHPEGWSADVASSDDSNFQAELVPSDPDASLQLSISVEPNEHGTDPEAFVRNLFEDWDNARFWGVTRVDGSPLVRLTVAQEGALIDVAYLLGPDYMVAVSMTSGYQPDNDPEQTDESRALFQTVIDSLTR